MESKCEHFETRNDHHNDQFLVHYYRSVLHCIEYHHNFHKRTALNGAR